MIDLNRIAGFHLVASNGGYAKAARAAPYPITQPALHQQVKKLQGELGVELLERLGKDVMRPTPAGQRLLDLVAPFLRDLDTLARALRAGQFASPLAIGAESLLIRQLLPDWLLALRRRVPGVQVNLRELLEADVASLRSGAADVLVLHLPEPPSDIATQQVAELHPCLVVPRGHAPARRTPPLRALAGLPFLSYPPGSRPWHLQMQALAVHGVAPPATMALDTADTMLAYVESGLGWSLLPSLDPSGPRGRRVQAYPLQRPRVTFAVVAAWRRDAPVHPTLDAFLDCLPRGLS